MFSSKRRFNYANVTATLALVFSMSGGALAAKHYLITSTKQIKPSVLKKLTGKTGKTGAAGAPGATGKEGQRGKEGPAGQSALAPLPSGASESGAYGAFTLTGGAGVFIKDSVTFPVPLPSRIPLSNIVWTTSTATHCSGPGSASPGYLCIYSAHHIDIEGPEFLNPETSTTKHETGLFGVMIEWETDSTPSYDNGTFTVTAP